MATSRAGMLCTICAKLSRTSFIRTHARSVVLRSYVLRRQSTEAPLEAPVSGGLQNSYPTHIEELVESISKLNLLEVSSLNELLKKRLNIADTPMMPMGSMMASPVAAVQESEEAVETQTEFSVKLIKFDDAKKVKLIKEIKTVMEDMNLVQAKKFVESIPQIVKEKISKEEADKLKSQLEAVGANIEIE